MKSSAASKPPLGVVFALSTSNPTTISNMPLEIVQKRADSGRKCGMIASKNLGLTICAIPAKSRNAARTRALFDVVI